MNIPENLLKLKILDRSESSFHVSLTLLNSSSFEPVDAFLTAPPPELLAAFKNWHDTYCGLPIVRQWRLTPKSVSASGSCDQYKDEVKHFLNEWLNDSNVQWLRFREKLIYLSGQLRHSHQEASILLDAGENQLNHFPLQEWQFLREHFPNSEIGLRVKSEGEKEIQPPPLTQKIRVLILIGTTEGLNTSKDLEIVQRLETQGAEVKVLVTPTSEELFKIFREDEGYDIFVFSGHSRSEEDKLGWIYINDNPEGCIQIDDFRNNFKCLIDKGLQLAIFNSCDGLGLAHQLAKLNLPRCIVMREPIPDPVAIRFIEEFFRNFTQNYPLFRSVNSAKISLEEFDQARKYPGAMWLPTLCVRQSALLQPFTWQSLKQSKSRTQTTSFIKDKKYLIAGILGCALIATAWGIMQASKPVAVTEETCPKTLAIASQHGSNKSRCFGDVRNVPEGTIWHGSSTTWVPINSKINPEIKKVFPNFNLTYKSHPTLLPGSTTGIKMLIKGQLVFAESSRPLKEDELQEARRRGFQLRQIPVAIDAIAFVVHPDLDIPGLSMSQLRKIYLGEVKNWIEVGGPDLEIIPYSRPESGGTTGFFKDNILDNQNFGGNIVEVPTTTQAIRKVSENPGGIYYASAPELVPQCTIKPVPILQSNGEFIAPYKDPLISPEDCPEKRNQLNIEVFQNNQYRITRKIFVIVKLDGSVDERAGEAYAELLLTDEGQDLIQEAGFIPLR